MIRIAIVEDEKNAAEALGSMLEQYGKENQQDFEIQAFQNAVIFLNNYTPVYDMIFMDIQMPYLDGMTAAARLRQADPETLLIFVTNMAQMAVKGYEVSAFDFVVKPLQYAALSLKLERALLYLSRKQDRKLIILSGGSRILLPYRSIYYIEVFDHQLIYHTENGNYPAYGTISKVKDQLEPMGFSLCSKSYLVNLRHVKKIVRYTVTVGNDELLISHPRKKEFLEALNNYIGA